VINNWDITETNLSRLSGKIPEVAVIPTGAVEPHNFHLPEGQDWLHTTYVSKESCMQAHEKGTSVIWLPTIPFGVDCNMLDFPIAVHVSQETLNSMLRDIIFSLNSYRIKKILIINGHGGNDFKSFIRQIQCDIDVYVFLCNWWTVGSDVYNEIFENVDDHSGELETSVALALHPHLVEKDKAGSGLARPFRFEAVEKGWISTSRRFSKLNDHCAAGDPSKASAEKGRKYIDIVVKRVSDFIVELSKEKTDNLFPQIQN